MLNKNQGNYIVLILGDGLCSEIVFMNTAIVASPIIVVVTT